MCHFALPRNPNKSHTPNPRYAEDCLELFQRSCQARGTRIQEYEAKIFGGSDVNTVYPREMDTTERQPVGEKNSRAAFELLLNAGANIVTAHVGEAGYRRIIFDISSGDVWVKFKSIEKSQADTTLLSGRN